MKISQEAETFYLAIKPELAKELKTVVKAYTTVENGKEVLGFRFLTPNANDNYIYVATNLDEKPHDILRNYLKEAKKQDLLLHLSFKDYTKFS